eukprot:CAMPEP_0184706950 /NCGR_PEP_ID=MMETSP0313-20130426/37020_1 /TAXON_ID=2792 /ORGANISM="Porphyridium aerugineum, Strain SAG 1380-2" /LENGTH=596 /DNA_ID=CAMNT_0027168519 /DNA_START=50 /DNA_END=1840 /DNA_ORIENTATION=-
MQQQQLSSIFPEADSKFSLENIFHILFSNHEIARWLLAKEEEPPCALNLEMMNRSVTCESMVGPAEGGSLRNDGSHATSAAVMEFKKEKKVFVCHANGQDYSAHSLTDDRTPLAFLEPQGQCVPGVRRGVCVRTSYGFAIVSHFWLKDGRSSMTIFFFRLGPPIYTEKHFVLLAPYPSYRYPKISDVLEILVGKEIPVCQFCQLRGYPTCECSSAIVRRHEPCLPAADQRDCWSMFSWAWGSYEPGVKTYNAYVKNINQNTHIKMRVSHVTTPTFCNPETKTRAYQHYLNTVSEYFNEKMLTWGNVPGFFEHGRKRKLMELEAPTAEEIEDREILELYTEDFLEDSNKRARVDSLDCDDEQPLPDVEGADQVSVADKSPEQQSGGYSWNVSQSPFQYSQLMLEPLQSEPQIQLPVVTTTPAQAEQHRMVKLDVVETVTSASALPAESTGSHANEHEPSDHQESELPEEQRAELQSYYDEIEDMVWTSATRIPCKFCTGGKIFSRKHDLKRHIKTIHMLERDFACALCPKTFKRKSHLEYHIKGIHEKAISLDCPYCDKNYGSESSLGKHVRKHHAEQLARSREGNPNSHARKLNVT